MFTPLITHDLDGAALAAPVDAARRNGAAYKTRTIDAGMVGIIDTIKRRRRKVGRHFDSGCIDVRFFHYPKRSIMVAAIAGRFIVYRCRPAAPCSLRSQS